MVRLVRKIINLETKSTSIRLCDKEWQALDEICKEEKVRRKELIDQIQKHKNNKLGLTAAIRLFTLLYYKSLTNNSYIGNQTIIYSLLFEIT